VNTLRWIALVPAAVWSCQAQGVEVQIRNVNLRLQHDVVLQVAALRGQLKKTGEAKPVTFDDLDSFSIQVQTGIISISSANLARLLNSSVFAYPDAPLKNIGVTYDAAHNRINLKGTMHKGVELPFEIEGSLSVTADGNLGLHADKIKSAHIPFKGLLHLFGEDLSKLVNVNEARGIRIEGDDIVLYPGRMVPPPHFEGRLIKASVKGDRLVQVFDSGEKPKALEPPVKARAYLYHRGGVLRFGRLTMDDSDLEIVGQSPAAQFEFCAFDYKRQLVAGYSKYTPSLGLIEYMPDYSRVRATSPGRAAKPRDAVRPAAK
jgi:hypothetical protein